MIKSNLTEADYIGSHRLFRRRTRKERIQQLLFCVAISAVISLYVVMQVSASGKTAPSPTGMALITFAITLVGGFTGGFVLTRLLYIWYESRLRKAFRTDKTLQAAVDMSWNADRLRSNSSYGEFLLPWQDVAYVRENENYILLYITDAKYYPDRKSVV